MRHLPTPDDEGVFNVLLGHPLCLLLLRHIGVRQQFVQVAEHLNGSNLKRTDRYYNGRIDITTYGSRAQRI
jgi:hypothetical protein